MGVKKNAASTAEQSWMADFFVMLGFRVRLAVFKGGKIRPLPLGMAVSGFLLGSLSHCFRSINIFMTARFVISRRK